jgi:hypothetical protein
MSKKYFLYVALVLTFIATPYQGFSANEMHPNQLSDEETTLIIKKHQAEKAAKKAVKLKKPSIDPIADDTLQESRPDLRFQPVKRNRNLGTCAGLGKAIEDCKPYACKMPHPDANSFMIDHEVAGFVSDDLLCNHTQTIPGNGIVDCRYPRAMRKAIAKQFHGTEDIAQGDATIVSKYFELFCKVIH